MCSEKLKNYSMIVRDIGFPIVIAVYLMVRQDRLLVEIINLLTMLNVK